MENIEKYISDYISTNKGDKNSYGEVFTQPDIIDEMLDVLPADVWTNPKLKWLDPANGIGNFPIKIINRLMCYLPIPFEFRYKYIIENMIYVCEIQEKSVIEYHKIFNPDNIFKLNIHHGSFLSNGFDLKMIDWNIKKFDIIIGNPPYQEDSNINRSVKPLYNIFIEKSINITDKILFITPSRWFGGGKGLDNFREMMKNSNKIKYIKTFKDKFFFGKSVEIEGGVSYFLYDKSYNGKCMINNNLIDLSKKDIIMEKSIYYDIVNKIESSYNLSNICHGSSYTCIKTNDILIVDEKQDDNYITCYVSKQKGFKKWINKNYIKTENKYHVLTNEANSIYKRFGNVFISKPNETWCQTYIMFEVNNKIEAEYLVKYLKTKFVSFLLGLRKVSQHIKPDTCKWIPLVPLDRIWTDYDLYNYFNLSDSEIEEINNHNY